MLKSLESGAGGSRTLVQTGKPYAFYMLIPAFGFRAPTRPGPPIVALSSKFSSAARGCGRLFPIFLHRLTLRFGTTSLERCLVLSPGDGIKPVIYCTSIRQRERSCFRHLNLSMTEIIEPCHYRSACLLTTSTRCQSHVIPM